MIIPVGVLAYLSLGRENDVREGYDEMIIFFQNTSLNSMTRRGKRRGEKLSPSRPQLIPQTSPRPSTSGAAFEQTPRGRKKARSCFQRGELGCVEGEKGRAAG